MTRLRKRVVFERLLARLQVVAPDAWVLKGGFALELRLGDRARTTKDADIDWTLGEDDAIELLMEAVELDLDDHFEFAIERAALDDPAAGGQRWAVIATLAGRQQHIAEKLHAYTRTYARDKPSSRVKDLVDLVVIPNTTPVDGDRLKHALREIFARRATHALLQTVPAPPADWESPWRTLVVDLPADADVVDGHATAAAFLDPILRADVSGARWDRETRRWT